jgi:hypothetical protein
MNVQGGEYNDSDSGQGSDAAIMLVSEQKTLFDKSPNCYERPHYVLGILSGLAGFFCLVLAMGWFNIPILDADDWRSSRFFYAGVIALSACFWFVYHAFGLIEFQVAPCVS